VSLAPDEDYAARFGGIRRLYGDLGAETLRRAHIAIVGIGGVGSWVVEALARSGVGRITLIDHDDIALSNINRQLHTLEGTLEREKVTVMAERIAAINPHCQVTAVDDLLTEHNLERHLAADLDYVVDCIDSIRHKAALLNYCVRRKPPVITTGGAGGISDPTRIQLTHLSRTHNDPLAAKVRHPLRPQYGFSRNPKRRFGIDCVFSDEQSVYPKADGSVCQRKPGVAGAKLDCNLGYGAATFLTGSFGFIASARVVQKLIERAERLAQG